MVEWIILGVEVASVGGIVGLAVYCRRVLLRVFSETVEDCERVAYMRGFKAGYRCRDDAREVWAPDGELLEMTNRN